MISAEAPDRARFTPEISFSLEAIETPAAIERDWRALEATAEPSFFLSWAWIGTLLDATPAPERPKLLRGTAEGRTVALACLGSARASRSGFVSRRGILNATGDPGRDCITIEHNGILSPVAGGEAAWAALARWFSESRLDELHIPGLAHRLSPPLVENRGFLRDETASRTYHIDLRQLDPARGDLGAALSANARSQLRRALRKFGALRLERARTVAEAFEYFDTLKRLHVASWERRGIAHAFSSPFFELFHRRLVERSFEEGRIELLRVSTQARTVGVLYNFRRAGRVYAYQSGFDEAARGERPGAVAHALAIRAAWEAGAGTYDFMAGTNRLKESFATGTSEMYWTTLQRPRLAVRLEHAMRRAGRALRSSRRLPGK